MDRDADNGGKARNPFSQLLDVTLEYNKRFLNEAIDTVTKPDHPITGVFNDVSETLQSYTKSPNKLINQQLDLWQKQMHLCQNTMLKMMGQEPDPVIEPGRGDRRFKNEQWQSNVLFDYIKQSYLLSSDAIMRTINEAEELDEETRNRLMYFTRQYVNALAPSNYPLTNPEVIQQTIEERGENLTRGMEKFVEDLKGSADLLNVRMTDLSAFSIGENIANTKGKVIYQNRMMQLIQYEPTTEKVHQKPVLIVPPWVNKYYIMDLNENTSLVKWIVDQGYTTFMISWVNPDETFADVTFDDYMREGPLAALDAIKEATNEAKVNTVGYCIGGILLTCTLAYLAEKKDNRVASATLFATGFDFSDAGDIQVFINDKTITSLEKQMEETGYFDGRTMAVSFNLLRENDLYWNYFIQNYLKGEQPPAYDLLYWNSDSTHIPAKTHSFFLRQVYLENNFLVPGGLNLNGVDIDISKIKAPMYVVATQKDHIAKWRACFAGSHKFGGPVRFVLGGSGHIAGIINPPVAQKYNYWTNEEEEGRAKDPNEWFKGATSHEGSWWPDWSNWADGHSGRLRAARVPGDGKLDPIEDAPGSYVRRQVNPMLEIAAAESQKQDAATPEPAQPEAKQTAQKAEPAPSSTNPASETATVEAKQSAAATVETKASPAKPAAKAKTSTTTAKATTRKTATASKPAAAARKTAAKTTASTSRAKPKAAPSTDSNTDTASTSEAKPEE